MSWSMDSGAAALGCCLPGGQAGPRVMTAPHGRSTVCGRSLIQMSTLIHFLGEVGNSMVPTPALEMQRSAAMHARQGLGVQTYNKLTGDKMSMSIQGGVVDITGGARVRGLATALAYAMRRRRGRSLPGAPINWRPRVSKSRPWHRAGSCRWCAMYRQRPISRASMSRSRPLSGAWTYW